MTYISTRPATTVSVLDSADFVGITQNGVSHQTALADLAYFILLAGVPVTNDLLSAKLDAAMTALNTHI